MKRKEGTFLICIGIVFIVVAAGLAGYNIYESVYAARQSDSVSQQLIETVMNVEEQESDTQYPGASDVEIPDYILFPEKEMPVIKVDNYNYIGILEMPGLELTLPVLAGEWSYEKLKIAPCVYSGSIYQNNMVIAAHNYWSHFSQIKNLKVGDAVIFTDCDDNVFEYTVGWVDILQKYDTEEMKSADDWDLTMFTCTYGGKERYTVRCIKEN